MAGICCGVVGESETTAPVVKPARRTPARRRKLDLLQFKFVPTATSTDADTPALDEETVRKRQKLEVVPPPSASPARRDCEIAVESPSKLNEGDGSSFASGNKEGKREKKDASAGLSSSRSEKIEEAPPKFGMTSVCGRRRDMEDAVSIHPSFVKDKEGSIFGVFDGHGCSHVAMKCRDRLHEIVKEEIDKFQEDVKWKETMERSFGRMDREVEDWCRSGGGGGGGGRESYNCRCELQTPQCDAVGSTAVVAVVTPDKIVVSNCGDSRAVLSRNGVAFPLSSDHKPDRLDELNRIEAAGGRVIYWEGPRVLGVLAMSRAIGDNYLKPFVIPEPEVVVTDRTAADECLILASDGLWDVVSNDTACNVARMCLRAQRPPSPPVSPGSDAAVDGGAVESSDKACSDASILLTKLALARHSTDNVSVVVVDLRRNLQQR